MSQTKKYIKTIIALISTVLFLALLSSHFYFQQKSEVVAMKGVINLGGHGLEKPIPLDGEWKINNSFIRVPSTWYPVLKKHQGTVDYSLKIYVEKNFKNEIFGLYFGRIYSSYAVFVNGEKLTEVGKFSELPTEVIPRRKTKAAFFQHFTNGSPIEVKIRVANFDHPKGGIMSRIYIGKTDGFLNMKERFSITDAFIFNTQLMAALIMLMMYYCRDKDISALYLFLHFFSACLYFFFAGEGLVNLYWSPSWAVHQTAVHVFVSLPFVFYGLFIRTIFEKIDVPIISYGLVGVFGAYSALALLFPIKYAISVLIVFHSTLVLALGYWVVVLINAIRRNKGGSGIFLTGLSICLLTLYFEIVFINGVGYSARLLPLGFFIFTASHIFVYIRYYSNSLEKLEISKINHLKSESLLKCEQEKVNSLEQKLTNPRFLEAYNKIQKNIDAIYYCYIQSGSMAFYNNKNEMFFEANIKTNELKDSFASIHRCQRWYFVNTDKIACIKREKKNDFLLVLRSKIKIPLGRTYRKNIEALINKN